ncbi:MULTISPECIES: mechanosensitive ion channel family protein [unclassified Aliivibrio]|uniref:mechanosensitive ion channel family protein n=1 Tax=unclassified Aliivibrio TaxID=2645654 RepID=UPI00080DD9BB|nr:MULTISPECIES: mechanosensitive ion channel family protein [unclassified Aliivibrio]OCH13710.1 mechanosensitive ion channel protein MscS [Aliivibrio sp. 1S165]OCH23757.1 mechanosensitive ion channel protein MscS [Aliivibrio sp. 1S128]OCH31648.1 mechanosensitive ion channel protein MscS [Aliivibrio sp. 1S175]
MLDHHVRNYISGKLSTLGINSDPYGLELTGVFVLSVIGVSIIGYLITRHIIVRTIKNILHRADEPLAEGFSSYKVFEKLTLLVPIIILDVLLPLALGHYTLLSTIADKLLSISILIVFLSMLFALLDALNDMAIAKGITRRMPIKSFVQLIKLFAFFVGIVVSMSVLANESVVIFLSGLGVATGFVMLVFKDTILGFVAGIQLSANRMISLNDWIEMDSYKANGTVEEISLTTVKVRNFDNTISMLPAYALVQNAFVNWQGMSDSGGRRIKRAVNIDVNSIRFMTDEEIESLKDIRILREYLFEKTKEIKAFNEELEDIPHLGNTRQMTNMGIFRAYLAAYLRTHKDIHPYMMFMVRQLEPTAEGLPLQIYAFTNNTDWVFYEGVQADIFDHIYSIMPLFDLRPYQALSGHDVLKYSK